MNPTASFFIKLSILISLSLQVCGSEFFSNSYALGNVQDELQALHLSRRQLQRRQAVEAEPAAASPLQDTVSKGQKPSKEEELAGKMFEAIIQMGTGLESVTSLGSNSKEVVEHSKKVQGLVPQLNTLTKKLMSAVPGKADGLSKSLSAAGEAGEALTKSLKAIDLNPEDANLIKKNFKSLEKSFHALLSAADNVAVAAIPQLAALSKHEDQKEGSQQPQGPAEQKPADQKPAEQNPADQKPAEQQPAEQKPAEQNATEPKGAEPKAPEPTGGEPKPAELQVQPSEPKAGPNPAETKATGQGPEAAEPKAIEPIVPDVVVPQQ